MAAKYLRRETAIECPVHTMVKEAAAGLLELHGSFEKKDVLERCSMMAMSEAIRWDYIREFLQDEQGCELVPLASVYFKRHKYQEELTDPQRFLAQGHGKKTAGYAAVTMENDHLIVRRLQQRKAMANGAGKAFMKFAQAIEDRREKNLLTVVSPKAISAP